MLGVEKQEPNLDCNPHTPPYMMGWPLLGQGLLRLLCRQALVPLLCRASVDRTLTVCERPVPSIFKRLARRKGLSEKNHMQPGLRMHLVLPAPSI